MIEEKIKKCSKCGEVILKITKDGVIGKPNPHKHKKEICFQCHDEEKAVVNQGMCYDCYIAWRM